MHRAVRHALILFVIGLSLLNAHCQPRSEAPTRHKIVFDTPSPGWGLIPIGVYLSPSKDEVWCAYQLIAPKGIAATVISKVECAIGFADKGLPIKRFVIGKTWNWGSGKDIVYLDSIEELNKTLANAERLDFEP